MTQPDSDFIISMAPPPAPPPPRQSRPVPAPPPPVEGARESGFHRRLCEVLALAIMAGLLFVAFCFHVPAHGGADQHAYLVAGKRMTLPAQLGSPKFTPDDPYQFVGSMWVGVDVGSSTERYYPKYPSGHPAIIALTRHFSKDESLVYWISPVATALAAFATFLLMRSVASSIAGLFAMIVFITSPLTLALLNNPNSHATSAAFVTLGMCFLIRWNQSGGLWRALLAGLLLGMAATIRYTEALLILTILVAIVTRARKRLLGGLLMLTLWALPIAAQVWFNLRALNFPTAYDATKESTAFSWQYFLGDATYAGNWETLVRQFNSFGLALVFSLAIVGLITLFSRHRSLAAILSAWIVPTILIYTFYYWAPDAAWTGYLRFFYTVLPALLICAFWLLSSIARIHGRAGVVATAVITALSALLGIHAAKVRLAQDQIEKLFLHRGGLDIVGTAKLKPLIPPGSIIFSQTRMLHHLDYTGNYRLYSPESFREELLRKIADNDTEEAQTHHPARAARIIENLSATFSQETLSSEQKRLIDTALGSAKRVFFITPKRPNQSIPDVLNPMLPKSNWPAYEAQYDAALITQWNDPNPIPREKQLRDPPYRRKSPTPPGIDPSQSTWAVIELKPKPKTNFAPLFSTLNPTP